MYILPLPTAGALLLLSFALLRRSARGTVLALVVFLIASAATVPVFLSGAEADQNIAAAVGVTAAAAAAMATLFVCRGARRVPMFSAVATLILGIAATVLVVCACIQPQHGDVPSAVRAENR